MDAIYQLRDGYAISVLFRLLFAVLCGTAVGIERQFKGHTVAAGCTTFCLVCVGSTLAMVANEYIVMLNGGNGDSARMAAQVISGIGFLGAGTIITTGSNKIRGLATAASLWVTAALGITIGSGFYLGAIEGVALVLISSIFCTSVQRFMSQRSRVMRIQLECTTEEFMLQLIDYFNNRNIRIKTMTRHSENKWYKSDVCVIIEMDLRKRQSHNQILNEIRAFDGLRYVEEI